MAALADSFITSPSLPVRTISPLPCIKPTSMVNVVPPTLVHAKPVHAPTSSFSSAISRVCFLTPKYLLTAFASTTCFLSLGFCASLVATFLITLETSLSKFLTPASIV